MVNSPLKRGRPRSKSFQDFVKDLAKAYESGKYFLPDDDVDIVKIKRDSFPTYNFDKEDAALDSAMKRKKKKSPKKSRK